MMNARTLVGFRNAWLATAVALTACGGGEAPPASPAHDERPPPIISVPQVLDAGATADAPDAAAAPPLTAPSFVAKRQGNVVHLAVDAQWIYWASLEGDIKREHAAGGPSSTIASYGPDALYGFAVNGGNVVALVANPKTKLVDVLRFNADQATKGEPIGTAKSIASSVTSDASRTLWATLDKKKVSIFVLKTAEKSARKIAQVDNAGLADFILSGNTLYLSDTTHIAAVALPSGKTSVAWPASPSTLSTFAIGGDRIFVVSQPDPSVDPMSNEHAQILSMPLAGGAPTVIASNEAWPSAIATDSTNVYWVDRGTKAGSFADGHVMKAALAGGAPTMIADHQRSPTLLAIDDDNIYWAARNESYDGNGPTQLDIVKVGKAGN